MSQVLDPILLLNASEWSELIEDDIDGEYVLIYQLHNNRKWINMQRNLQEDIICL